MKIQFSFLWLFFLPLIVYFHLQKVCLFLFILMSTHECMHVLIAKICKYKIEKITIYPFGLCASIENFEYRNSILEIIVTVAGLSVHVVVHLFLPLCKPLFSPVFLAYMQNANIALLLFNCLPIYPLDGGRIVRNILELFLPYQMAKKIAMCTSCIFFIICMYTLSFTSLQRCFFSIVMSVYYISLILYFKKDVHTFYMYRFIHPIQKNIKMHSCNDIYKNHTNVYIKNGCIKNEKDFLYTCI